jgi:hypothetical protein
MHDLSDTVKETTVTKYLLKISPVLSFPSVPDHVVIILKVFFLIKKHRVFQLFFGAAPASITPVMHALWYQQH